MRKASVVTLSTFCTLLGSTLALCQTPETHGTPQAGQERQSQPQISPERSGQTPPTNPVSPPSPAPANPSGNDSQKANQLADKQASVPSITDVEPHLILVSPKQTITLKGSNFQVGVVVTFTDDRKSNYQSQVKETKPDQVKVVATLPVAGIWTVSASNDGKNFGTREFPVQNQAAVDYTSPAFVAFALSSAVATLFLLGIIVYVLVAIQKAQHAGWSLGEALSEESTYQPKAIDTKSQVIIFASTSRVIALVGLMGILSTVVGMGYSIMWNLTIYGTVPDLSEIRSFLLGSACLFAPYLANQLSGIFTPSAKPQPAPTGAQASAGAGVTGIVPTSPLANAAPQAVQLTGSGFQAGLSLTLTDPSNASRPVAAANITAVAPTLISASVVFDSPGSWKSVVANPAAAPMTPFAFSVLGPPTITAVSGAAPVHAAAAQNLTFSGTGFMSGVVVKLTPPAGGAAATVTPTQVTAQQIVLNAVLANDGDWQAVATNPGNHDSPVFPFHVN